MGSRGIVLRDYAVICVWGKGCQLCEAVSGVCASSSVVIFEYLPSMEDFKQ